MSKDLELVPMQRLHLPGGLALSRAAGWPHRAEDWASIYNVSKGVVGMEDGALVATGFCTVYDDHARLNMIIVDERLRGRGFGKKLVGELVALAESRPMALVATEDGFPLYRKFGFEPAGQIEQYQGIVTDVPVATHDVRRSGMDDLPTVLSMDRRATGVNRANLLTDLFADAEMFLAEEGFALRRNFGRGKVIGPVVAARPDVARSLIAAAATGAEGSFVRIDTDPELGMVDTIKFLGLGKVGDGTVMFAGPRPEPKDYTAYTLASQALG